MRTHGFVGSGRLAARERPGSMRSHGSSAWRRHTPVRESLWPKLVFAREFGRRLEPRGVKARNANEPALDGIERHFDRRFARDDEHHLLGPREVRADSFGPDAHGANGRFVRVLEDQVGRNEHVGAVLLVELLRDLGREELPRIDLDGWLATEQRTKAFQHRQNRAHCKARTRNSSPRRSVRKAPSVHRSAGASPLRRGKLGPWSEPSRRCSAS